MAGFGFVLIDKSCRITKELFQIYKNCHGTRGVVLSLIYSLNDDESTAQSEGYISNICIPEICI